MCVMEEIIIIEDSFLLAQRGLVVVPENWIIEDKLPMSEMDSVVIQYQDGDRKEAVVYSVDVFTAPLAQAEKESGRVRAIGVLLSPVSKLEEAPRGSKLININTSTLEMPQPVRLLSVPALAVSKQN